jgi:hypothetical protein
MRFDPSLTASLKAADTAVKTPAESQKKSAGTVSFARALKSATTADTDKTAKSTTATTASDASSTSSTSTSTAKAAETTAAVPGHAYADILTGPRSGLYLNMSGNKRDGQAFVMVERNGREFHIYGTGAHRTVVSQKAHDDATSSTTTDTTGTTTDTTAAGAASTGTSTATGS